MMAFPFLGFIVYWKRKNRILINSSILHFVWTLLFVCTACFAYNVLHIIFFFFFYSFLKYLLSSLVCAGTALSWHWAISYCVRSHASTFLTTACTLQISQGERLLSFSLRFCFYLSQPKKPRDPRRSWHQLLNGVQMMLKRKERNRGSAGFDLTNQSQTQKSKYASQRPVGMENVDGDGYSS